MNSGIIQHKGIVQNIQDNELEIMILSESACSACKSKKVCSISEIKEKIIFVKNFNNTYHIGDQVNVLLEEKMGILAVVFAYGLPFVVMISILLFGFYNNVSEPIMGLSVVLLLTIYYITLYLLRNQIGKKMTFKVEKLNNTIF